MFQDIHVMIFVGFGFLMTFLSGAGFTAIGINYVIGVYVIQWAILCRKFWEFVIVEGHFELIEFSIVDLITGDFSAAVVLITFGVLIGNVSPSQLMIIAFFETIVASLGETIMIGKFKAVDMGGSIALHLFGGVFGIALSFIMRNKINENRKPSNAESTKYTDLFAMIGTLFLFLYWPSFNGALAGAQTQHRVIINTILAITGSAMGGFCASQLFNGKLKMEHIQNATLAGGVAVGSAADLVLTPWLGLLIGFLTGIISVAGYCKATPFLRSKFNIRDTCGVLNLHLVPGLFGGIVGVISSAAAGDVVFGDPVEVSFPARANGARSASTQALYQLASIGTTIAIALASAIVLGVFLNQFTTFPKDPYNDAEYWEVPHEEGAEALHEEIHPQDLELASKDTA
jgi:ammonium transporter Rh